MSVDPIEENKKAGASASSNAVALMAQMLDIRANSVLKQPNTTPTESVGSSSTDPSMSAADRVARMAIARSRAVTEQSVGKQVEKEGAKDEGSALTSLRADRDRGRQLKESDDLAAARIEAQKKQADGARSQQEQTSGGFSDSQQRDQLSAFLQKRGYERLRDAGTDAGKIKAALDDLAQSDVDADTAVGLYHMISTQFQTFDSAATLAALMAGQNAAPAAAAQQADQAAQTRVIRDETAVDAARSQEGAGANLQMQALLDGELQPEMPCYLTPHA